MSDENQVFNTANMLQTQYDPSQRQALTQLQAGSKRNADDEIRDRENRDGNNNTRRNSLPPFKKRHLDLEEHHAISTSHSCDKSTTVHPATKSTEALVLSLDTPSKAFAPQDIAARLQAFEDAQRRSNASRELLAMATRNLQRVKQLQRQRHERLIRLMTLKVTAAAAAAASSTEESSDRVARVASCASGSGSLSPGISMTSGAAW